MPVTLKSTTRPVRCLISPSMMALEGTIVVVAPPPILSRAVRSVAVRATASPVYSFWVSQNQIFTFREAMIDFLIFESLIFEESSTQELYHGGPSRELIQPRDRSVSVRGNSL